MINASKLEKVRKIICHKNPSNPCPDGVASALILRDAFPEAEIAFSSHYSELDSIPVEEGVLFCDICPGPSSAGHFLKAGAIVLDHHATAEKTTLEFERVGQGAYSGAPGVSGAMLACEWVWLPEARNVDPWEDTSDFRAARVRDFAFMVGIRDTWQKQHREWTKASGLSAALAFWPWDEWPIDPFDINEERFDEMLRIGPTLYRKELERAVQIADKAATFRSKKGVKVAVVPTTETNEVSEVLQKEPYNAELVVGFSFRAEDLGARTIMGLSTRSRGHFDCQAWMKTLGGGGHIPAAGGQVRLDNTSLNPYTEIERMLALYEAGLPPL